MAKARSCANRSVWHPILKIDCQLSMDHTPVLTAAGPLFGNIHHCQIQHFEQALISRKHGFRFCYLAKLAVKNLQLHWSYKSVCEAPVEI